MATTPEARLPSQEHLLLDYMHRLEEQKDERRAVHLHLSALKPFNRREQHIRAAASGFEGLIKDLLGQLFILGNSDLVFIFKREALAQVETAVQKIKFLFSDDPLLDEEEAHRFATWHDMATDYGTLLEYAQSMAEAAGESGAETPSAKAAAKPAAAAGGRQDTRAALKARQEKGEPITPAILGRVEQALARADLSNLVRRQYICTVSAKNVPEPVFSELFISIADLRETLIPGVNLSSNRWLFQHMTETLDQRVLVMLSKAEPELLSGDISFNLNVKTLLSQEFLNFDDNITAARRGSMIIELQKVDIFADLGAYLFAREYLQDKGYRICIDGLTFETMSMLDREKLGADMMKLIWHPDLMDGGDAMHAKVREMVGQAGANRVVLTRVDNREAVDFGRSVGIHLYQGRYVETLIAEDNRRRELLRLKRRIERG
jgi:hypothetical protein